MYLHGIVKSINIKEIIEQIPCNDVTGFRSEMVCDLELENRDQLMTRSLVKKNLDYI